MTKEVEEKLSKKLEELGLPVYREYKIHSGKKGIERYADIYIPAYPRCIIEIKKELTLHGKMAFTKLMFLNRAIGVNVFIVVVIRKHQIFSVLTKGYNVVFLPDQGSNIKEQIENTAKHIYKLLRIHRGKNFVKLKTFSKLEPQKEFSEIHQILVGLEDMLNPNDYTTVNLELKNFIEEYKTKHFTAAALRIGRCLEYITFMVSKTLGVKIENIMYSKMDQISGNIKKINDLAFEYENLDFDQKASPKGGTVFDSFEQKKTGIKRKIHEQRDETIKLLTSFADYLDSSQEKSIDQTSINNVSRILKSIGKKFENNSFIRERALSLANGEDIKSILTTRNESAHASLDGRSREIDREQVNSIINSLNNYIGQLSHILATGVNEKKSKDLLYLSTERDDTSDHFKRFYVDSELAMRNFPPPSIELKIHDALPEEILKDPRGENIIQWCKTNRLSDHLVIVRTGQSIEKTLLSRAVERRKIFLKMFANEVSVKEAIQIAKSLKELTYADGMVDIVLGLTKGYIKIKK